MIVGPGLVLQDSMVNYTAGNVSVGNAQDKVVVGLGNDVSVDMCWVSVFYKLAF